MQRRPPVADNPPSGNPHASSMVRVLSRRYLLVLVAVAVLVVVDQAIIQPLLVGLNFYAPAINVAGRQRMLSQKVTKDSLALVADPHAEASATRRDELRQAIDQWTRAHRALLEGDERLGLESIEEPKTAAALRGLEPSMAAIRGAATELADIPSDGSDAETTASRAAAPLQVILAQEPKYLHGMEQVVGMLEESAGRRVDFLRWCGMAAMLAVLALLLGVYFFVLRPATRLIRDQIEQLSASENRHRVLAELLGEARDELESRVAVRTRELSTANRALEREILERQTAETRMRELSAQLAHVSRVTALGQLATGLAHEINQPLATIANCAATVEVWLNEETLDLEQTRKTMGLLKQAALRAGLIVRRMRNFVRPASGQCAEVELNELVREVCDLCRPQLVDADVELTAELADGATSIRADGLEIQQVLVNLIQNATQALATVPRGRRTICIRTRAQASDVHVSVIDSGPGFSSDSPEDSFAPFLSTKSDGLGMGLAISRTILDRYQGRIWGENRLEGGAEVGFYIPYSGSNDLEPSPQAGCVCR